MPSIKTLSECLVLLILTYKDYSVLKDRGFLICFRQTLSSGPHGARSIQPKFQPVRPGKEDHLKRWTRFSKLFRLDRTDPLSFGPKFPESLVEWIAPMV